MAKKISEEQRKKLFIKIFLQAKKHYSKNKKRLAAESWDEPWQTLIATMLSAQTRDETTIPVAENLFKKYDLKKLGVEKPENVMKIIKSINYNKTKSEAIIKTSKILIEKYNGKVPSKMESLLELPGVGRKTANLVLSEIYGIQGICVDTHVHRISNVLGLVETKNPEQTEQELQRICPDKYWSEINRYFVLWGKEVPGKDKDKLLKHINFLEIK